jgi:hypothetical protein
VLQIPDKLLGDERRLERVLLRLRPQIRERLSGRRLVRQGGDEVGDVYTHDVPPHKRRSASGRGQGEGAGEAKRERERERGGTGRTIYAGVRELDLLGRLIYSDLARIDTVLYHSTSIPSVSRPERMREESEERERERERQTPRGGGREGGADAL